MDIKGLDKLINDFDAFVNGIDGNVKQIVEQEANRIAGEAKALAPVDGGYLREKIQTRTTEADGKIAGEVYNNANYAAYVEFGTGPVGQAAGLKIDGIDLTRGQAPQPFLYPAMKNNEDHIVETLKTAVRMESKINR